MNQTPLLLIAVAVQQGLFSGLWAVAARLHISRLAALHWSLAEALGAIGIVLVAMRGSVSPYLSEALAIVLMVGFNVLLRRGIEVFARHRPRDREHALVMLVAIGGHVAITASTEGFRPAAILSSLLVSWVLLRAAAGTIAALTGEFGVVAARWYAAPMTLIGAVFGLRVVVGVLFGWPVLGSISGPGAANATLAFLIMVNGMLLNAAIVTMVILRLVRRLQHQSDHDSLTGLLVRRAMERQLHAEAQRQQRLGSRYALLSLDIDHFKSVNDTYGHGAGDAVLVRLAQTLLANVREVDSVGRMGGEEFCVLLPGADASGARRSAERLLAAARALDHPECGNQRVTVSIGLIAVCDGRESPESVAARLDAALYAAKANGRDRIEEALPSAPA